jgi:hypothetical protein
LAAQVVDVVRRIRTLDLRKAPSISETLDWARALILLNAESLSPALIEETLELILKYDRDVQKVGEQLPKLLNGAYGPGAAPHEHTHHDHHHHDPEVQARLERKQEHTDRYFGRRS